MINPINVLKSSKKEGIHEAKIIKKLFPFFQNEGFTIIPHARFNIAWGNILSDIDMLLIKDDQIGVVEIKSSKDDLRRAKKQIDNLKDYVDFVYIATDYHPRKFPFRNAGLIHVGEDICVIHTPKSLVNTPRLFSIDSLPKKCLCRMSEVKGIKYSKSTNKFELAEQILNNAQLELKQELKEIVTCGLNCDSACPIWNFENQTIPVLITR